MDLKKFPIMRNSNVLRDLRSCTAGTGLWKDIVIAGGFGRWLASPHHNPSPCQDIDLFCNGKSEEVLDVLLGHDNMTLLAERETPRSASVYDEKTDFVIQVIKDGFSGIRTGGTLAEILAQFDFTVVQAGLYLTSTYVYATPRFLDDEKALTLVYACEGDNANIFGTLKRVFKYKEKGYSIPDRELIKILEEIHNTWTEEEATDLSSSALDWLPPFLHKPTYD